MPRLPRSSSSATAWIAEAPQGLVDAAGFAAHQVDMAPLEDGAGNVGLVGVAGAEAIERRFLVPEGGQEPEGKLGTVKRGEREGGYGFFDLDWVHGL